VKFIWDFADGNTVISSAPAASHTYTAQADYTPRMILEDADGCRVPIQGTSVIHSESITPVFATDKILSCDSLTVRFTNNTTSNTSGDVTYQWAFGDGTFSTESQPSHHYTTPGSYQVQLSATTSTLGCTQTGSAPAPIRVVASPKPSIVLADSSQCVPATFTFSQRLAPDTSAITSYRWEFGNGANAAAAAPGAQLFASSGLYRNALYVTNSSGCVGVAFQQVQVDTLPAVNAGGDLTICRDKGAAITAKNADTYVWSPAAGLNCTNCATAFVNTPQAQQYVITGTDRNGCVGRDTILVKVLQKYTVTHTPQSDTICAGKSVQLAARGDAQFFSWTPAVGLTSPNAASTLARPLHTTTYRLVGYDSLGCFNDTSYIPVQVYPTPQLTMPDPVNTTVGTLVKLQPKVSADVTRYKWSPAVDLSCDNCATPLFNATQNRKYALTVTNEGGCRTTGTVDVYVSCLESTIFIPNTFSPNTGVRKT
jgi:PKD repeat protein